MVKFQLEFIDRVRTNPFLRNFILSSDVLDFIACQFAFESNFGSSSLAKKCNNFCGMKIPRRRVTYCKFSGDDFAEYDSFDKCVLDYISWIFYHRPYQYDLCDLNAFISFLNNSGYCPEKDYISKIQLIYSQLKSYENGKSN